MKERLITAAVLAVALVAVSGRVAIAQDRGQEHARNTQQEHKFRDQDRQATDAWVRQHQKRLGVGWRQQDRLAPDMQARLRAGERLDPQLRRQMHPVPADLARRYGPAPRGYRYVVIGGNVVLIDDGYQVHDLFGVTIHVP